MRPSILATGLVGALLLGGVAGPATARSPAPDGSPALIDPLPAPSASPAAPVLDAADVAGWLGSVNAAERDAADTLGRVARAVDRHDWTGASDLLAEWSDGLDRLDRAIDDTPAPVVDPPRGTPDCAGSYAASYRERSDSLQSLADAIADDLDRKLDPGPRVPTYAPPWGPRNLRERLRAAVSLLGPDRAGRHDPAAFINAVCDPAAEGVSLPAPEFAVMSRSRGIAFGKPVRAGIATLVLARNETDEDRAYHWRAGGRRGVSGDADLHRAGSTTILWTLGSPDTAPGPIRVLREATVPELAREMADGLHLGPLGIYRASFGVVRVPWRYTGGVGGRHVVVSVVLTASGTPVALARAGLSIEGPDDEGVLLLPLDELQDAAPAFDGMAVNVDMVLAI